MVHLNNDDQQDVELETTNDEDMGVSEPELEDLENKMDDKIKKLKVKINRLEEEKKEIQNEAQRTKADFLNARKRLDEDRAYDRVRYKKEHVEKLLPLCDSFQMAMSNKEVWEKTDENWRNGINGIYNQLMSIIASYDVKVINPKGESFDPYRDEAVGTEEVDDEKLVDKIVSVVQQGYEMKVGDRTEVIRHARVTTGIMENKN